MKTRGHRVKTLGESTLGGKGEGGIIKHEKPV